MTLHCVPSCDTAPSGVTGCTLPSIHLYTYGAGDCWADGCYNEEGLGRLGLCLRHADEIL